MPSAMSKCVPFMPGQVLYLAAESMQVLESDGHRYWPDLQPLLAPHQAVDMVHTPESGQRVNSPRHGTAGGGGLKLGLAPEVQAGFFDRPRLLILV